MPIVSGGGGGSTGTEIGYDQITSPVNVVSTTEATGTTIITCAAHVFDGSPVLATFFTHAGVGGSTISMQLIVCLFEGATQIGRLALLNNNVTANPVDVALAGLLRFTPTAASHTYTVTAFATNAAGPPVITAGAGGTNNPVPTFIRFTKV